MQIVHIFALVRECLYSVLFETTDQRESGVEQERRTHEFDRLFDFWTDPVQLRTFFEAHEADLEDPFWEGLAVEEAILKTKKEAQELKKKLLAFAEADRQGKSLHLSELFSPLTYERFEKPPAREKTKIKGRKTWLRMYAVRVDTNVFVICGGAIKLRPTINDRDYLQVELDKLNYTKNYLSESENDLFALYELK